MKISYRPLWYLVHMRHDVDERVYVPLRLSIVFGRHWSSLQGFRYRAEGSILSVPYQDIIHLNVGMNDIDLGMEEVQAHHDAPSKRLEHVLIGGFATTFQLLQRSIEVGNGRLIDEAPVRSSRRRLHRERVL